MVKREKEIYGSDIEPGGNMCESSNEFLEWAAKYDEADVEIRSKKLHDIWISGLECPIIRIEGDMTVKERVSIVKDKIK